MALDDTAEGLLGLRAGSFDGSYEASAALVHPEDRDRVMTMLDRAVESDGSYELEYRVTWPDGAVHWLQGREFRNETGVAKVLRDAAGSDAAPLAGRVEQEARGLLADKPHDDMAVLVALPTPRFDRHREGDAEAERLRIYLGVTATVTIGCGASGFMAGRGRKNPS